MDIAELGYEVDTQPVARARDELGRFVKSNKDAEDATDKLDKRANRSFGSVSRGAKSMLTTIQQVAAGIGIAFSIKTLFDITNAWTDMNSRVRIAAGGMAEGAAVMERLESMARRTYSSLTLTAESWLLNSKALKDLGYSTNQQLDLVEALNNALVVSGAKGERAASVINAFSKAMALGKLSGDQLETVLASGGRVTSALAESLGVATTDLRKMGQEGKLTGDVLYKALTSQLEKLRAEADSMPATVGDAFVLLGNSIMGFVGRLDEATGFSSKLAEGIIFVADNIGMVAVAAQYAAPFLLAIFGPLAVAQVIAFGGAVIDVIKAIGLAAAANPFMAIILGITTLIALAWTFRDDIQKIFGIDVAGILKEAGNFLIRTFLTAFEQVKYIWNTLPAAIGAAAVGATNAVIKAINFMIGGAISGINNLIGAIQSIPGLGDKVSKIDGNFGQIAELEDGFSASVNAGATEYAKNAALIAQTDYVGQLVGAYQELTKATDTETLAAGALDLTTGGLNKTLDATGGSGKKAAEGIKATTNATMEALEKMQKLREEVAGYFSDAFSSFFKDIMKGKDAITSLKDALGNLADKMMDMVLNGAFNMIFSTLLGGGGSILGGAAIPTGGFIPGLTGPKLFADGGIINGPTYLGNNTFGGEAGPEGVLPLKRGSNGQLGVISHANNNGNVIFVQPIIQNNASDQVETTATVSPDGDLLIIVDKLTAQNMANPASKTNKAARSAFGLRNTATKR